MVDNCGFCAIAESGHPLVVFEDEKTIALLSQNPVSKGHIILLPRKHHPIVEQTPDEDMSHLFVVANKLSMLVFEKLGCKGTNILINNGIASGQKQAHLTIHVIPRYDDDGLNLEWKPKQLGTEQMSSVEIALLGKGQQEQAPGAPPGEPAGAPAGEPHTQPPSREEDIPEDSDMGRSLERIP